MAIIVISKKTNIDDLEKAREEHKDYIKITIDIVKEFVAIGGEYHAGAKKILLESFDSKQKDIWGGGYNILTKTFETIAIINLRQNPENQSMEILNPDERNKFLNIARRMLPDIESLE